MAVTYRQSLLGRLDLSAFLRALVMMMLATIQYAKAMPAMSNSTRLNNPQQAHAKHCSKIIESVNAQTACG